MPDRVGIFGEVIVTGYEQKIRRRNTGCLTAN